jgi:hypothetical protein
MKRSMGMQKLKRRFSPPRTTMGEPLIGSDPVPGESGTYPISGGDQDHDHADAGEVTLVVYGWHNVQPGTLSWVFPSFDAAIRAARALRNATQWAIMGGSDATGRILAECGA